MAERRMVHVIIVISFVACVGLIIANDAGASTLIQQDSFSGNDGSSPDTNMWTVYSSGSNDYVRIEGNTVRTHVVDTGRTYIWTKDGVDTPNLTMLVDWMPRVLQGNCGNVVLYKNVSGNQVYFLRLSYGASGDGWALRYIRSGYERTSISFQRTASVETWYTWNITIRENSVNITITERDSGYQVYTWRDVVIDQLNSEVTCQIGSFATESLRDPSANWDNYRMYNLTHRPNAPPRWLSIPLLLATEDVPLKYNFTLNVSDLDNPMRELSISGISPFITAINGLEVTYLFPNNVTTAEIPMVLSDGIDQVVADINFTVIPVNDPPEHAIPTSYDATEEITLILDLEPYVWDVDNEMNELFLVVDDIYSHVDGLVLTVEFPEGINAHQVLLAISDGLLLTPVWLNFTIFPVDDPPTIDDLGELEVVEDQETTYNITPFLHDIDTPREELTLTVSNPHCTIDGHLLILLYTIGGVTDTISIMVNDEHSSVGGDLVVIVTGVNDPPIAHTPPPRTFTEGTANIIDLSAYIEDEDTPRSQLTIECHHPAVISIDGLTITMLYEEWRMQHLVDFSVSDGDLNSTSSFMAQVIPVNDEPVITGIGDLGTPYVITIDEGTTLWFNIEVYDEDGEQFRYDLETEWEGIVVLDNGTLMVTARKGEVGEYYANLLVIDEERGTDDVDVKVLVANVNDPPTIPVIVEPENATTIEKGANITFDVDFTDPDIALGQVLTVTWTSNRTGPMMELTSDDDMSFVSNSLSVGEHLVTVTVSDGEYSRSAWVEIRVLEPHNPPPTDNGEEDGGLLSGSVAKLMLLVIIVFAVIVAVLLVNITRSGGE